VSVARRPKNPLAPGPAAARARPLGHNAPAQARPQAGLQAHRNLPMKLLIDFFPIILFFVAFKLWGIYTATAVAIVATIAQIAYLRLRHGKVEPMQWVSLGVIVLFGGATLLAHNDTFIKWKPTVLYWLMGGALLVGQLLFRKNLLRSVMGGQLQLPDAAWRTLNWSWAAFFALMGALNLVVAYRFDTDTWVNFKLFGGMGLMLVFVIGQAVYMSRFMQEDKAAEGQNALPGDKQP
jgi:intracellular septation protein